MKRNIILGVILIFIFFIMGFGLWNIIPKKTLVADDNRPLVMTSFYPLYFFVSEVGGDKVRVLNMTPAGVEPHDYEPTARDLVQIQKSKILFISGNGFEAWGSKIISDLQGTGVKVVELSSGLVENSDPHVWLSPRLAKEEVLVIASELIKADNENVEYYLENAKKLLLKLDNLTVGFETGLSECKRKQIITSHSAFGYLVKEFGLSQVSISGLSPEEEPSTKQLVEIAKIAKKEGAKYIFFEKLVSPKLAETIASEISAGTLVLDPIEGISDNDIMQSKNYITLMEENLANLRIALECQ